jgi:hypothetical protein
MATNYDRIDWRKVTTLRATGNTYAHRQALRSAGFTWDEDQRAWIADLDGLAYNRRASVKQDLFKMTRDGVKIAGE